MKISRIRQCLLTATISIAILLFSSVDGPPSGLAQENASDPVIVGAGDISTCGSDYDLATSELLDNIDGTVITLGDNVYSNGTESEFNECYDPTWGRHKARTQPAVGNHEYGTPNAAGYYNYFGAAAGDPDKGYYSYDLGAWHIVVLNSQCSAIGGCDTDSPQGQWLQDDLDANPASCTLAYWHHPRFSSGDHGNNSSLKDFWQILYDAEADLVLNGHDHNYERFALQDPDGAAAPGRGIREIVVGTGGKSLRPFLTTEPNSEVRNADTYGVLKLTLHPASYDWEFIPIDGQIFTDSGSAPCVGTLVSNQPPEVAAGADQTMTLPEEAILNGMVSDDGLPDPPGSVTTTWRQVSGPGSVTFGDASALETTAAFSAAGDYVLSLDADDGDLSADDRLTVTVIQANQPPVVDAGIDQVITLPNEAILLGAVTDDGLPTPPGTVTTTWRQVSGPGAVTFGDASALETTAAFSAAGVYVLSLDADDGDLGADDRLIVTVSQANQPPVVDAGVDQVVTLPNEAMLLGTVTDDGLPNPPGSVTTTWNQVSGPGAVTFGDVRTLQATAGFAAAGHYVLRLTADDGEMSAFDEIDVEVTDAENWRLFLPSVGFHSDGP